VDLGQSVTQVLFKVISDILTYFSKYSFIEETKKMKEQRTNKNEEKDILTFTIMNIEIMIEKSVACTRVLSNKFRMLR
jgi:hypothetical protein